MVATYRPNDYEAACAFAVARLRGRFNSGQENLLQGRTPVEEQLRIDYVAALAEIAACRLLNMCWTGCGRSEGGGPSYDVGGVLQVRSITNPSYGLITRMKDNPDDVTALVLVEETRMCTLLGAARNAEVRMLGLGRDLESSKPYWTLPQSKLTPIESFQW